MPLRQISDEGTRLKESFLLAFCTAPSRKTLRLDIIYTNSDTKNIYLTIRQWKLCSHWRQKNKPETMICVPVVSLTVKNDPTLVTCWRKQGTQAAFSRQQKKTNSSFSCKCSPKCVFTKSWLLKAKKKKKALRLVFRHDFYKNSILCSD